ncbi:hypothetical protein SA496_15655 [Pseudomonas sp. JS3066]|uniref:hypothetical protein n=1 Tax=Pseudomonas sp. JS3066 TaxID=3090665 RepID=UPI002E7AFAA9|nr:hypothetical protein [Pseudomonas sp. JS3066]WVK91164.1 hypothetical protein SA496_15655 [Pseudomonas sp. JS3066]
MRATLLAASIALMTTGCASIFSEDTYPVHVTSSPAGATIEIRDEDDNVVYNGTTPAVVKLSSSAGYFDGEQYTVKYSKPGYSDEVFVVDSGIEGWYWGNLLVGGLLGMLIIDPATGAMYDLPTKAGATMKPLDQPIVAAPTATQTATSAAMPVATSAPLSQPQWQEQQLQQLKAEQGLSYEEYQRRYRQITAQ